MNSSIVRVLREASNRGKTMWRQASIHCACLFKRFIDVITIQQHFKVVHMYHVCCKLSCLVYPWAVVFKASLHKAFAVCSSSDWCVVIAWRGGGRKAVSNGKQAIAPDVCCRPLLFLLVHITSIPVVTSSALSLYVASSITVIFVSMQNSFAIRCKRFFMWNLWHWM